MFQVVVVTKQQMRRKMTAPPFLPIDASEVVR